MPTDISYTPVRALRFEPLTQEEWDAYDGMIRIIGYNSTLERLEINDPTSPGGQGLPIWPQTPVHYDALVDNTIPEAMSSRIPKLTQTLQEAIDNDAVSILLHEGGDTAAITIAAGDSVQRIHGKDADTTPAPSITCNKDNVTFEQLGFNGKTLTLDNMDAATVLDVRLSGTGRIATSGTLASYHRYVDTRVESATATPLVLGGLVSQFHSISGLRVLSNTGASDIAAEGAPAFGSVLQGFQIDGLVSAGTATTDYHIKIPTAGGGQNREISISNFYLDAGTKGGIDLSGVRNRVGPGFINAEVLDAGRSGLRINVVAGEDVTTLVHGVTIVGAAGKSLLTYVGADAEGAGLIWSHLHLIGGGTAFLGQDNHFYNVYADASVTVDVQNKTGVRIMGGAITTLSNPNADIYLWGVKGQNNRGHNLPAVTNTDDFGSTALRMRKIWTTDLDASGAFTPGTFTGHLLPTTDNTYDVGSVAASWRDIFADRNALIGGTLGVTGAVTLTSTLASGTITVTGNVLPEADNTRDLGSAAFSWRDLFVDRNALIGGTLGVTGTSTLAAINITGAVNITGTTTLTGALLFSLDDTYDIGAAGATRPNDLYLGGSWKEGTAAMHVLPSVTATYDLGALATRWRGVWAGAGTFTTTVDVGTALTAVTLNISSTSVFSDDITLNADLDMSGHIALGNNVAIDTTAVLTLHEQYTNGSGFGIYGAVVINERIGTGATGGQMEGIRGTVKYSGTGGTVPATHLAHHLITEWNAAASATSLDLIGLIAEMIRTGAGDIRTWRGLDVRVSGAGSGLAQTSAEGIKVGDLASHVENVAGSDVSGVWVLRQDSQTTPTDRSLLHCSDTLAVAAGVGVFSVFEAGTSGLAVLFPNYSDATRPSAAAVPAGTTIYNSTDTGLNVSDGTNWRAPTWSVT